MQIKAYAKINWSLSVLERLPNGYHALDMLLQSIALADCITLNEADQISLTLTGNSAIPNDQHNLAIRAAQLLRNTYNVQKGVAITLDKQIPIGAGLGGGSADAAAVLYGLTALWALSIPNEDLRTLAVSLGADVPFCLVGGLARAKGIGEKIMQLGAGPSIPLLIVQPDSGLSTAAVFASYDIDHPIIVKQTNSCIDAAQNALLADDLQTLAACMRNDLQDTACHMLPEIRACMQAIKSQGALCAQMTGSGSAVIGLFSSEHEAKTAYMHCSTLWKHTFLTQTHPCGVSVNK